MTVLPDAQLKIEVKYSCSQCGLHRVPVPVPARTSEDVIAWMNQTLNPTLVADHERRSPKCHPETLTEVMIPIDNADRVGGAPVQ